jgi:hypothetical protein
METFHFRTLTRHHEYNPYEAWCSRCGRFHYFVGIRDEVDAHEAVADREQLVRMIQRGDVMPTDLVFSHGMWRTFEDAPEFDDACVGVINERALEINLGEAWPKLIVIAIVATAILFPFLL